MTLSDRIDDLLKSEDIQPTKLDALAFEMCLRDVRLRPHEAHAHIVNKLTLLREYIETKEKAKQQENKNVDIPNPTKPIFNSTAEIIDSHTTTVVSDIGDTTIDPEPSPTILPTEPTGPEVPRFNRRGQSRR